VRLKDCSETPSGAGSRSAEGLPVKEAARSDVGVGAGGSISSFGMASKP
jgi:hypothetical protein